MDSDSLVYDIKTSNFYEDITSDIKARFNMSSYSCNLVSPLPIGVNKKVIGLMKDKLGGRIMTEFVALRPKLYTYKMLSGSRAKRCNGVKKCIMKKTLDFEDYNRMHLGSSLLFWNKLHEVHTIEMNMLALSRDDNK